MLAVSVYKKNTFNVKYQVSDCLAQSTSPVSRNILPTT